MSVDVGEINLATLCIKKINWKDKTLSDNELLTYLPLRNNSNQNDYNLQSILDFKFDRKLAMPIKNDKFTTIYSYF